MRILANSAAAATIAVALAAALFIPTGHMLAGLGECPGFTSEDIDDIATEIGLSSLAAVDLQQLICTDVPRAPALAMSVEWQSQGGHSFSIESGVIGGGQFRALITSELGTIGGQFSEFSVADTHICRAEALRSFTWRRLCAGNVDSFCSDGSVPPCTG